MPQNAGELSFVDAGLDTLDGHHWSGKSAERLGQTLEFEWDAFAPWRIGHYASLR
jgi:hypothetical protein